VLFLANPHANLKQLVFPPEELTVRWDTPILCTEMEDIYLEWLLEFENINIIPGKFNCQPKALQEIVMSLLKTKIDNYITVSDIFESEYIDCKRDNIIVELSLPRVLAEAIVPVTAGWWF
jgi:hypothetical protein